MSLNNRKSGATEYLNGFVMSPRAANEDPLSENITIDYMQDKYLEQFVKTTEATKNLITAANVGVFSLTFVAMFVNSVAEYASKFSNKIGKIVAPDAFYCGILYITAMMSKLGTYGKWISSGLLTLFGFVMIRKSNAFKMLRPNEKANYWYFSAAIFALLYAYKQANDSKSKKSDALLNRILNMSSNFNSVAVLVLLFLGSKNYNIGVRSGSGSVFYGGSHTPPNHAF